MSVTLPPHAPYRGVTVGGPVEVQMRQEGNVLIAEVEFQGDKFGSSVDLSDAPLLEGAVDELVTSVSMLVWNELLGTPVFREEDDPWTGRVEVQAPWQGTARVPTEGLIDMASVTNPDALAREEPEQIRPEPDSGAPGVQESPSPVVSEPDEHGVVRVAMSEEDARALARGEIPANVLRRVVETMPTMRLLEVVTEYVENASTDADEATDFAPRTQALRALAELRSRVG